MQGSADPASQGDSMTAALCMMAKLAIEVHGVCHAAASPRTRGEVILEWLGKAIIRSRHVRLGLATLDEMSEVSLRCSR